MPPDTSRSRTGAAVLTIIILIIVLLLAWMYRGSPLLSRFLGTTATTTPPGEQPTAMATYSCAGGKTIGAAFYNGPAAPQPQPGQPPQPTGYVQLQLSDGRQLRLQQTISADGVRYSDGNPQVTQGQSGAETFVFWSKGNGALVLENNEQKSYIGCVVVAPDPGSLPQVYSNQQGAFSVRYPSNYTPDTKYTYQALGPGKNISGVKFTIPQSMAQGTNLSDDTYISVEQLPQTTSCTADHFLELGPREKVQTVTEGDTQYSFASTTGAAAGNRYEEWVYAYPGTNPCMAVRYFIHYGVLENYPQGSVQQFNESSLLAQFDAIRHTLTINE